MDKISFDPQPSSTSCHDVKVGLLLMHTSRSIGWHRLHLSVRSKATTSQPYLRSRKPLLHLLFECAGNLDKPWPVCTALPAEQNT